MVVGENALFLGVGVMCVNLGENGVIYFDISLRRIQVGCMLPCPSPPLTDHPPFVRGISMKIPKLCYVHVPTKEIRDRSLCMEGGGMFKMEKLQVQNPILSNCHPKPKKSFI